MISRSEHLCEQKSGLLKNGPQHPYYEGLVKCRLIKEKKYLFG